MTWGVVTVQHPSVCNAWSHTCHPFTQPFKDFPIKSLIDSLSWWHKFLVDDHLIVKKTNEHRLDFGFAHSRFLGTARICSVPLPTQRITLTAIKRQFTKHLTVQLKPNKHCYMCFTEIVNLNNPTVTHKRILEIYYE